MGKTDYCFWSKFGLYLDLGVIDSLGGTMKVETISYVKKTRPRSISLSLSWSRKMGFPPT